MEIIYHFCLKVHCVCTFRHFFNSKENKHIHNYEYQCGASDSDANLSALSNPADAQNVSCLGLCGRDICPKSYASYDPGTLNPHLSVSI